MFFVSGCQQQESEHPEESITLSELKGHVYYLSSDLLQGRMTGSEGYLIAANYAASQFKQSGLRPAFKSEDGGMTYYQQVFPSPPVTPDKIHTADYGPDTEIFRLLSKYSGLQERIMIPSDNVAAFVIGSDPSLQDEYISAGAHLDHVGIRRDSIYNGADDNASGCSLILEVAEAVALSKPKRSVIFILYTAEEMGMVGSEFFIAHSPVQVTQIKANLNFDMVGRPDGVACELGVIGASEIYSGLQELIFSVNDYKLGLDLDTTDYNDYFRRSDQYSFYSAGIPAVLFTTGEHPEYHTPGDDPEKIDYEFLRKVSDLAYETIMDLANGE